MENQINWEIFMPEEQAALKKAIQMGLRDFLTQCVIEMSPAKEKELQKLADNMSPVITDGESEVMREYIVDKRKKGLPESPQSPAEEAELQKMLDEEQLAKQKEFSAKNDKQTINLEEAIKPLEDVVPKPVWKKKV